LLAPLLDIPLPKERTPALAPEELRRRQLAALTNWVMAGAKVQPVVLAFEDLHWADPTTLDVLRGIAERGALAPLLVVATTRPEFRPPWSMRSHHGTISLAPLDRAQVQEMVAELSARHALPRDVVEDVAARTGGVPLFVEEVTRLLLERGAQGGIQSIPPTLQQSLMARLDRLGPAREVAQIGSVIGRGFYYGLLRDVAGMEDAPLQAALEKLAEADIVLVQGLPPESDYRFKHALIQDAAYENLLKSRRQVLHRRVAEILRDRFAATAAAEPEALAYHFTQAGMTDAAIEWWGKAGDQALRRSAFQEAISHLGNAIEMADKDGEAKPRAAATAAAGDQRLRLQTSYGNALLQARGMQSAETQAAFSRARDLGGGAADPLQSFSTYYGLWAGHFVRGELAAMQEIADLVLRDVEARPASLEAVVAFRLNGATQYFAGNFTAAVSFIERSLAIFDPQHQSDHALRFAQDVGVSINAYLALVQWPLGALDRSRATAEQMVTRAARTGHPGTAVYAHFHFAVFEMMRRSFTGATPHIEALVKISQAHEMGMWTAYGRILAPWTRRGVESAGATLAEMRRGLAICREQGVGNFIPFLKTLLAEAEAEAGELGAALATVDDVIAETERTGQRWNESDTLRVRGEILLRRDPANTAPAEEAFLSAIAVAREQKARSFELRAALALAKLYQSRGRAADAHAVLAPALEGFSPMPEFPEIEQAQTLLAALVETDEVRNAATARQRRLKLQTSYGQALLWSSGFGAEETKASFVRAKELAAGISDAAERFPTYYGLWVGSLLRGEFGSARQTAEVFLHEAKTEGHLTEAAVASRNLGLTCLYQGEVTKARAHLEEALRIYDPDRDRDVKIRFAQDHRALATAFLAQTTWVLGEVGRTRALVDEADTRAVAAAHVPTLANTILMKAVVEIFRGDPEAVRHAAEAAIKLGQEHGLTLTLTTGMLFGAWARARLGERDAGATELRQALGAYTDQGNKLFAPLFQGLLAEIEAEAQGAEDALARIGDALALAGETGEHWTDALLHRMRGEILLKRDPANTAPAEEAFLTAIAIAREQKAKSFELRAALSLAKPFQSTGRAADAHAVLAPALEGFSPTPEFPEIAEAQRLLGSLGSQRDQGYAGH
jgi:predicted ATPase